MRCTAGPRTIYVAVCRGGDSPADQYSFALPSSMETVAPRRDKSCGRVANKFGLRTWTFGFTCLVFKTTCVDRGKPLYEGAFSFTRRTLFPSQDKRNTRNKAKGLRVASERCIGELGARCLSTLNGGQDSTATVSYGYGQHLSEKTKKPPRRRSAGRPIMRSPVLRSRGLRRAGDTTPI